MKSVWSRVCEFAECSAELSPLLDAVEDASRLFEEGHMHVYRVAGDGYSGIIALLFEEYEDKTMRCTVEAFRGEGVVNGIADLVELLGPTPARRLELNAETFAHVRLYQRAGFAVDACRMGMEL